MLATGKCWWTQASLQFPSAHDVICVTNRAATGKQGAFEHEAVLIRLWEYKSSSDAIGNPVCTVDSRGVRCAVGNEPIYTLHGSADSGG